MDGPLYVLRGHRVELQNYIAILLLIVCSFDALHPSQQYFCNIRKCSFVEPLLSNDDIT